MTLHRTRDHGFTLVEVLVSITLAGMVLPAVAGLAIVSLRTSSEVERRLDRVNLADAALDLAILAMEDPEVVDVEAYVSDRLDLQDDWRVVVSLDSAMPPVLWVTVTDSHGGSTDRRVVMFP